MKKTLLRALAIICLLTVVGVVAYFTHVLEFYTTATTSNLPTYKHDDLVFASSLKKPDNNDFIVFNRKNNIWIFRCIGKENDVVEIKDAIVYVNGKVLDEPYTIKQYYIETKDALMLNDYFISSKTAPKEIYYGMSVIELSDNGAKELQHKLNKPLKSFSKLEGGLSNENLYPEFLKKKYNEDNIGPIKVPKNSYFVLGDNRHDAYDSRYFGFVNAKDVVSTVIR